MKRRVLVTGASRGIGRAIAEQLANDGFAITVHGHRGWAQAQAVAAGIVAQGGDAQALRFDVRERALCHTILEEDVAAHGAYYGIVCNAGVTSDAAFPALTGEDWDSVIDTSLDGFYNIVHPLIMPMIQTRAGGRITVISSVSGIIGNRGQVNYSAAKAGLIGASKALATELASRAITVNCVAPGIIETDMIDATLREKAKADVPMRRIGTPAEVAALVGFLMSDAASYITRQVIGVNGGIV